ncbi:hypothetical protein HK103_001581 [Boothiomyces macroporosus]|uniref:Expansin-like EG45 domain-containing protein n=2 Tax=Boothiomyces macroporosus TaxID=261099 RepID=A0AAD5Y578_9FUNG|nr:hypothetical protein HK103_001581 [Boothiomyces macroporosus]
MLFLLIQTIAAQWSTGLCTFHDYEGDYNRFGKALDNNPGWCGIRYSVLNVARITAMHGISASSCNQCLEFSAADGSGPSVYVLVVDQKGAEGLDVAQSSFAAAFPGKNSLDPETCRWRIVDPSKCGKICYADDPECNVGERNILAPAQLPPANQAPIGLNVGAVSSSSSSTTSSTSSNGASNSNSSGGSTSGSNLASNIQSNSTLNSTATTTTPASVQTVGQAFQIIGSNPFQSNAFIDLPYLYTILLLALLIN